jgi:hypothetical protein
MRIDKEEKSGKHFCRGRGSVFSFLMEYNKNSSIGLPVSLFAGSNIPAKLLSADYGE